MLRGNIEIFSMHCGRRNILGCGLLMERSLQRHDLSNMRLLHNIADSSTARYLLLKGLSEARDVLIYLSKSAVRFGKQRLKILKGCFNQKQKTMIMNNCITRYRQILRQIGLV